MSRGVKDATTVDRRSLGNLGHTKSGWRFPSWWTKFVDRGLSTATVPGFFDDGAPKLLSYTPKRQWTFCAVIFARDLTSFNGRFHIHFSWILYAVVVFLLVLWFDEFEPIDEEAGTPKYWRKVAIRLEAVMLEASKDFRSLVAYVIGGFVVRAFSMWYARRKNYASLCGTSRNLILNIATAMPAPGDGMRGSSHTPEELRVMRSSMGRWVVLALELASLKARAAVDSKAARAHLEQTGLLHEGEWDAMVDGDRHTTTLFWVQSAAYHLADDGALELGGLRAICEGVTAMRAQANDLMSSLDRDMPYPYTSLVGTLVKTNLFLMSTWRAMEASLLVCGKRPWSNAHKEGTCAWFDDPTLVWELGSMLLTLLLWNTSYAAMYDLAKTLHNPFGNRRIDVAHEAIAAGIRRLAEGLCDRTPEHLPPAIRVAREQRLKYESTHAARGDDRRTTRIYMPISRVPEHASEAQMMASWERRAMDSMAA